MIRIVKLGAKHGREILVWELRSIHALMERPRRAARSTRRQFAALRNRIPVPLRVLLFFRHSRRGVRRHRVDTPMNKDPELGFAEPGGSRTTVQRFPGSLVLGGRPGS